MLFKSQKDYQTPPPRIADRVLKTEGLHDIQRPLSQEAADVQARIHDRVVRKRKRKLPMPRPSRSSRDGSAAPGFPPKWSSFGEQASSRSTHSRECGPSAQCRRRSKPPSTAPPRSSPACSGVPLVPSLGRSKRIADPPRARFQQADGCLPTSPERRPVSIMILPQVHLRKPCYDFYFL